MKIVGIICEYNPFHLGHRKQIGMIRHACGQEAGIVCLMSGNFVQRGMPAVFHKSLRARAALLCGADLVLELPVQYALSSAEGFAAGSVRILSGFCDTLCFGTETGSRHSLMKTTEALLSPAFSEALRAWLDRGLSFPAARQAALGDCGDLLSKPNDILAVEYCKAILAQKSPLEPMPIPRQGSYHAEIPDPENPSATAVRGLLLSGGDWRPYIPEAAAEVFTDAPVHSLAAGERAMLARLRTMTDAEFEALPYGSEGLWRKFMHACRTQASMEEIIAATKSKRYTRTRIDRMAMCAFLGLSAQALASPPSYARVLGFNEKGRTILKKARLSGSFPHVGEAMDDSQWILEQRCADLYGLFRTDSPAPAGTEPQEHVFVLK